MKVTSIGIVSLRKLRGLRNRTYDTDQSSSESAFSCWSHIFFPHKVIISVSASLQVVKFL